MLKPVLAHPAGDQLDFSHAAGIAQLGQIGELLGIGGLIGDGEGLAGRFDRSPQCAGMPGIGDHRFFDQHVQPMFQRGLSQGEMNSMRRDDADRIELGLFVGQQRFHGGELFGLLEKSLAKIRRSLRDRIDQRRYFDVGNPAKFHGVRLAHVPAANQCQMNHVFSHLLVAGIWQDYSPWAPHGIMKRLARKTSSSD